MRRWRGGGEVVLLLSVCITHGYNSDGLVIVVAISICWFVNDVTVCQLLRGCHCITGCTIKSNHFTHCLLKQRHKHSQKWTNEATKHQRPNQSTSLALPQRHPWKHCSRRLEERLPRMELKLTEAILPWMSKSLRLMLLSHHLPQHQLRRTNPRRRKLNERPLTSPHYPSLIPPTTLLKKMNLLPKPLKRPSPTSHHYQT